jgi:DNA-binding NarL/FixJ family response regulator
VSDDATEPWFAGGPRQLFNGDRARVELAPNGHGAAATYGSHKRTHHQGAEPDDALDGLRILIIDDCTLHRENLADTFRVNGAADLRTAWDLPSLVVALEATQPNIMLLNVATHDSALLLRAATDINPDAKLIVLGVSDDDESQIVACAEAGAAGYHMRTESLAELLVLIRQVAAGETSCSSSLASMLLRRLAVLATQRQPTARELALTGREAQILQMLELGLSNHDIATQLSIAVHTVKNHVHSLLKKLGVGTRAEAAALARTIRLHRQ